MTGPVGLGFRVLKGGSVVVGVTTNGNEPRIVSSSFLATAAENDRLSLEPYHVAAEMARGPDGGASAQAAAAVAEGRRRQDMCAAAGLGDIIDTLRTAGSEPVVAALLVNRAGWISDLLDYSLAFADHPPVAEGLAVRDALRFAFGRLGIDVMEMDEKSLGESASKQLGLESADIDARLKTLGTTVGKPWRKEQKLACLAAWVAVAARR
ncbi:hypothetical protein GCM10009087_26970 [Sphingomonas oligophenolica]|uniref:Uncharacterized protein n=1 Tax=Sphingomonas oligophenolica TaxID=301154 RepID=A0ABU9YC73_9SPHN